MQIFKMQYAELYYDDHRLTETYFWRVLLGLILRQGLIRLS